ncbi:MAG TPA: hypothetical protein VFC63_26815 [Blastocatellia bacterium]|nr:hypothetical protein [Blastocatellia bacterium]
MAKKSQQKNTGSKRGRTKISKLDRQAQEINGQDMKKVKGGAAKPQELDFNLQQIQQTLNRVNETVTNLSRSQSDAEKSVTQNLSV